MPLQSKEPKILFLRKAKNSPERYARGEKKLPALEKTELKRNMLQLRVLVGKNNSLSLLNWCPCNMHQPSKTQSWDSQRTLT